MEIGNGSGAMDAPTVWVDDKPLPKRNAARTMVPGTWVGRTVELDYATADGKATSLTGRLLDWCPVGLIVHSPETGRKVIVSFERICVCSLVED